MRRICEDCGRHYDDLHRLTICPHVLLDGGDTIGLRVDTVKFPVGLQVTTPERAGREDDTQPLPTASDAPIAHEMVIEDLRERLRIGIKRYSQPLQAHNGRDSLQDAYEEALDLCVYLKNAIYERDHPRA